MIIDMIKSVADRVKNGRTPLFTALQVGEEAGELLKAIKIDYDPNSYKKQDEDGVLGEGCDIIIATVDTMLLKGHTKEEIVNTIAKKLEKWERKANGGK